MLIGNGIFAGRGDENILDLEVMVAQHCDCPKCYWIVHFEIVILCFVNFFSLKKKENTVITIINEIKILHIWKQSNGLC